MLDLSLTGLMPDGMRSSGQDDTYSLTLKLEEQPKSDYKLTAEAAMQDFMKTGQRNVAFSAELGIMGTDTVQGMQFKAGSPSQDYIRLIGLRSKTQNGENFEFGYKMNEKQLELKITTDGIKKAGETWRRNVALTVTQARLENTFFLHFLKITIFFSKFSTLIEAGLAETVPDGSLTLNLGAAGKETGFIGELILLSEGTEVVHVTLDIDTENMRGSLLVTQVIMAGAGFDKISLAAQWRPAQNTFTFLAKRDGNQKMVEAKVSVLGNGVKLTVRSGDNKFQGVIPKSLVSKAWCSVFTHIFDFH